MTSPAHACRHIRRLLAAEQGMALPIALFAMIAGMALVSAVVISTVNVQQGSHRDVSTKGAIAVADAGANIARSRIDRYATALASHSCLKLGSSGKLEGAAAESDGWCPAVVGTVGGGEYSYRVSPAGSTCGEYKLCVVATGTVGEVSRRIEVAYSESAVLETKTEQVPGEPGTGEGGGGSSETVHATVVEGIVGQEGIEVSGNADIQVGVGTNGNITASGNATFCRDIRHGVGKKFTKSGNAKQCAGYKEVEGNKTMPPVTSFMPTNIATSNSDSRLETCTKTSPTREPTNCELDSFVGTRGTTEPWKSSSRAISVSGNNTLTVSGGDYWVCTLNLSGNSQLIMGGSSQVRFFFDTPEHCGLSSGATQLSFSGNTRIASTNKSVYPAFYFLGSTTKKTKVNLGGNAGTEDEFVIYGPNTTIELSGNATYKGVIAGKSIVVSGNGKVENDTTYEPPIEVRPVTGEPKPVEKEKEKVVTKETTVTTARYYSPQFYVECTGAASPGAAPNSSC
jgi:hypothetical protein